MKIRMGFVTNSSSTGYIITNKTNTEKTLEDFVRENPDLLDAFIKEYEDIDYNVDKMNMENMIKDAKRRGTEWEPNEVKHISFGDEDGDLLGRVFDYILRDGGNSASFHWKFREWLR